MRNSNEGLHSAMTTPLPQHSPHFLQVQAYIPIAMQTNIVKASFLIVMIGTSTLNAREEAELERRIGTAILGGRGQNLEARQTARPDSAIPSQGAFGNLPRFCWRLVHPGIPSSPAR